MSDEPMSKDQATQILKVLEGVALDHYRYKSQALEHLMTSIYQDFLEIKEKMDKIEGRLTQIEQIINR